MKKPYIITRIDGKVYGKEVNSIPKPKLPDPEKRRPYDGQMEAFDLHYKDWEEAEYQLQEYPLSAESKSVLIMKFNEYCINRPFSHKPTFSIWLIGQTIIATINKEGELIL